MVTGRYRSGTTFLAQLLASQPDILMYRDFLVPIFRTATDLGVRSFLQPLTSHQRYVLLHNLLNESEQFWSVGSKVGILNKLNRLPLNLKELYYDALSLMGKGLKGQVVGSKVTNIGQMLGGLWIRNILNETDVDIIYIYRDARDVMLSERRVASRFDLYKFAQSYRDELASVDAPNERIFKVKFEDLMLTPKFILSELEDFLDVEMRLPEEKPFTNSSFQDVQGWFSSKSCYRWVKQRGEAAFEILYLEVILGELLDRVGYSVKDYDFSTKFPVLRSYYMRRFRERLKGLGRRVLGA